MKRVNTHLSGQEIEGLEKLSMNTGIPKAEIIRRAVDSYLENRGMMGVTGIFIMKEPK